MNKNMMHTVVGVFENVNDAERAADRLVSDGFKDKDVDISADYNKEKGGITAEKKHGIRNFFKNLFGEGEEANNYTEMAERGRVVTVHTGSEKEAEHAAAILDECGAINPNERMKYYREHPANKMHVPYTSAERDRDINMNKEKEWEKGSDLFEKDKPFSEKDKTLPVIEEKMKVGKTEIEKDKFRIRSRIIERPIEEHLRLRVEHIHVDREPADRPATDADMETFKEGVIEATETEEIPVVKKEARVVEDVKLRKEVEERGKTIRESVRKQDVNVERKNKERKDEDVF